MMMNKKVIVYIGNDFSKRSNYNSTMNTLSGLFETEGYQVVKSSGKKNKFLRILAMCSTVLKYSRTADYILIDTFSTLNFYYALVVSQLARALKIRYIPILHGGNLPKRLDNNRALCKAIFKNSYKNIAPSMYLKTHFEKKHYKTEYVPNVITIKDYFYKERKVITPNLLWVRAFDKIYNPQMAIEVLYHVKKLYPEAKLCMVGPEKDQSRKLCENLISMYELIDAVTFTGLLRKEEWHHLSENYDVFINTTNIDNTPVSVIEAMALGLPVISTNIGGLPFLIEDGVDGILVNCNDAEQMSQEISKLIEETSINMARKARKKVEHFDWTYVAEKWKSILS
ncbi:glycosyltransferase family 4 protein [Flavobacteriaceae bacterium S356]|uniref:Glycosyltransferase family 4 protein n=1 Tax=Asprobacillus argus TaxID=3076534 RepID=A0ABU3LDZ3_9FLAO|nr:glycosyltransferase family 4 protein [Flavobacteriaceae bacterium S356]